MAENKREETEELTFEQSLSRLEAIVQQLEEGDAPLEQAIELFQEGMLLSKRCNRQLEAAEKRIEMLMEEDGDWVKKPFAPEEEQA